MARNPKLEEEPSLDEVKRIVNEILPLLHGNGARLQASVLGSLAVMWVCGFTPASARPRILAEFVHGLEKGMADYEIEEMEKASNDETPVPDEPSVH